MTEMIKNIIRDYRRGYTVIPQEPFYVDGLEDAMEGLYKMEEDKE